MKRKRIALWLGLAAALLLLAGAVVWAASDVAVARKAISTGGGARASASYAARDTTGQSAIGVAQDSGFRVRAGFWARAAGAPVAGFRLAWDVLAGGGSARSAADYGVGDTVGQSAIGVAQGGTTRIRAGFWHGVRPYPAEPTGPGTLTGQVLLQARSDHSGALVQVNGYQATTDASGNFTIPDLPAGSYTVSVSLASFLGVERAGVPVVAGKTTTLPPLILLWGDANGDGVINIYDLALIGINFGMTSSPWAGEPVID